MTENTPITTTNDNEREFVRLLTEVRPEDRAEVLRKLREISRAAKA